MNIEAKCRFCYTGLHLDIDDSYSVLGDPLGLIPLAACNRCADLRERRRKLHEAFSRTCAGLLASPRDPEVRQRASELFTSLTKRYVSLISEWTGAQIAWEEAMTDPFLNTPQKLAGHIKSLWYLGKQQQFGI